MVDPAEIQDEILAVLYEETVDSPFSVFTADSILEDVAERFEEDIEENDAEFAMRRLDEEFLVDVDPAIGSLGTVQITPRGVEEYNRTHNSFLKTENWHSVLELLQDLDRENPGAFWTGEALHEDLEMEEEAIARNVWYLKEKGLIDVSMTTGDPPYSSIQITRAGRKAIKSHSELLDHQEEMITDSDTAQYDVFISHASEDKEDFVRPLANALDESGLDVWYDEFELEIGDSLRDSIDRGLANSDYGIVVLSEAYFEKDWAQYELNGLVARDIDGDKVILPVWYQINTDQVVNNSPSLADKYALQSDGEDINDIASQLQDAIEG